LPLSLEARAKRASKDERPLAGPSSFETRVPRSSSDNGEAVAQG
jgi:hypothetical protein